MSKQRKKSLSPSLTPAEEYCREVGLSASDTANILSQCHEETRWPHLRSLVAKRCAELGITVTSADQPYVSPHVLSDVLDRIIELREPPPGDNLAIHWLDQTDPQPAAKQTLVAMTEEDRTILEALATESPMAVTQPDLEATTHIPRPKIAERLEWLEAKGFVARPEGTKRKGQAITTAGLHAIGRSPDAPH